MDKSVCDTCGFICNISPFSCCPSCDEGVMKEVELECICGKCYSYDDIERACILGLVVNSIWTDPSYGTINSVEATLVVAGHTPMKWCYGIEAYEWVEYYKCTCGEILSFENGT